MEGGYKLNPKPINPDEKQTAELKKWAWWIKSSLREKKKPTLRPKAGSRSTRKKRARPQFTRPNFRKKKTTKAGKE